MSFKSKTLTMIAMVLALATTPCGRAPAAPGDSGVPVRTNATANALPAVVVHKNPSCGCCLAWVEHLRSAGFEVDVRDEDDLDSIKHRVGVPSDKRSCHTAEVGGSFVEGHVPASDIKQLLREKPTARGLALPGMPIGSPGMERPDGSTQPYAVELVGADGSSSVFARH